MLPQPCGNTHIIYEIRNPRLEHLQSHHLWLNYASTEGFSGEEGHTPLTAEPTLTALGPEMSAPGTNSHTAR